MINTLADILHKFLEQETKKLNEYHLTHPSTIGQMYERLTSDLLNKSIPNNLGLKVVEGFITNDSNELSKQIDCMLVVGEGEKIPYTDSYKWHIKDVLAVFEVKKNLNAKELNDSWSKFNSVMENQNKYIQSQKNKSGVLDVKSSLRAFEIMSGRKPPTAREIDELPMELQYMYHALIVERFSPIRIIVAYNGYKSEKSLRKSILTLLSSKENRRGFGAGSLPQLIICGKNSIVKVNGLPYCVKNENMWWTILASSKENPILFLLEFLWTRLNCYFPTQTDIWGDDLILEELHPLLKTKVRKNDDLIGWDYNYIDIPKHVLNLSTSTSCWQPIVVNKIQYTVFNILCRDGHINLNEEKFISFLKKENIDLEEFILDLLKTGLVAKDNNAIYLTTEQCQCVVMPNGDFIVGENNNGKLTRWIEQNKDKVKE